MIPTPDPPVSTAQPVPTPYIGSIHADKYEIIILIEDDTKSTFNVRLDTDLSSDRADELPFHILARRTFMVYGGVPSSHGPLDPYRGQHEVYASWFTLADLREGLELIAWDEPELPGFSKLSDESLSLKLRNSVDEVPRPRIIFIFESHESLFRRSSGGTRGWNTRESGFP